MRIQASRAATLAALSIALSGCGRSTTPETAPAPAPAPAATRAAFNTGEDVLAAMRERYAGKWYSTLTFTQKTSRLGADGKWNVQTWYEALHMPGRLRIDFDPISAGSGVLYARDSAYSFQNGRAVRPQAALNPLLVLGFDVYFQPAEKTAAQLRKEGFDLSRVHRASFDGRPMIVVGAREGETRRKQFWIDAEHLYFVRLTEPLPNDSSKLRDTRFVNYRREGNAWVSPRVELYTDGKLVFYEDYSDVKTNVPLDARLFDPASWKTAKHWMNQ